MSRFVWILLVALAATPGTAQEREWTKAQGEKFRAKFVRELDGEAVFLQGNQILTVPLDELAEADRKAILDSATKKADAEDPLAERPPPRPAEAPKSVGPARPLVKPKTPVDDRDWSDIYGNRTFGIFVRVVGREVLIRRGASPAAFPFDTLTPTDQAYVNQVLTERGEQPLLPLGSLPSQPQPLATEDPPPPTPESAPPEPDASDSPTRQSQFYEELRRRQEERRLEQAEFAKTNEVAEATPAEGDMGDSGETSADPASSQPQAKTSEEHVPPRRLNGAVFRIDRKTLLEMRPIAILSGVLIGLIVVLGVIIYIATSIASSNPPHRQRKFY